MAKLAAISASFTADFEVGRNIVRNADALCELVVAKGDTFNKLIVIQAGALVEACLHEIIYRAENFTKEGLPNISKEDQAAIADEDNDTFFLLIEAFKKHKLLDKLDTGVYEELHTLRQYRNKIHIQSDAKIKGIAKPPRAENELFDTKVRSWAVGTTYKVIDFISKAYPRPKHIEGYVKGFVLPTE